MPFADDFRGDPYGFLVNQSSHFLLGFMSLTFYTWVTLQIFSVYIDQVVSTVVICLVYLLVVEIALQGWRGLDTILDTYFFSMGAAPWLVIDMEQVLNKTFAFVVFLAVSLSFGMAREFWRSGGDD